MDHDIREIAKDDVRAAMRREIELNREAIVSSNVKRTTPRQVKEYVFERIARNEVLIYFMNLENAEQQPEKLLSNMPISQEYIDLMHKIGATRYPLQIRKEAQRRLYYDYTHSDYKRNRHFLDQPLPRKSKTEKFGEILEIVFGWIIVGGIFFFLLWGVIGSFMEDSRDNQYSQEGRNTFGEGGISGGNPQVKSVNDLPQLKDNSNAVGFGNGGVSGNDSTISDSQPSEAPRQLISSKSVNKEVINAEKSKANRIVPQEDKEKVLSIKNEDPSYFTLGSTKSLVNEVMGEPKSIIGDTWSYGYSSVYFGTDEDVIGWSNISSNLKVFIGEKNVKAPPFTIGSSQQDVVDSMGTPTSIIGETWSYQYSSIYYGAGNTVIGWSNISRNLNVSIGTKKKDEPTFFTVGSSKQEVIDAMGAPTSIIGNTWSYEYSSVYFDTNNNVSDWTNISGSLKIK